MTLRLLPAALLAVTLAAGAALAQAPMTTAPGAHPPGPHMDSNTDGPAPHVPATGQNRADGGGAPAHLHNEAGDTHRPDAGPSPAGGAGMPRAVNQPGDGPAAVRPGRGPN
ncbi:hypothetical protein ACI6QG_10305 [Roseococcus sp. DSY-14]|uniref:hypothetical protein n=1 Tax=Roseococcus sp. DSY-14 TaxID=3369650 RepID=UPI00387B7A5A